MGADGSRAREQSQGAEPGSRAREQSHGAEPGSRAREQSQGAEPGSRKGSRASEQSLGCPDRRVLSQNSAIWTSQTARSTAREQSRARDAQIEEFSARTLRFGRPKRQGAEPGSRAELGTPRSKSSQPELCDLDVPNGKE